MVLSNDQRNIAIGLLLAGRTQAQVAAHFGVNQSTVQRLNRRYQATGSVNDRARTGRPRVTTLRQDRHMRLSHLRNRFLAATATSRVTPGRQRPRISSDTVRRRLRSWGIRARRPYIGSRLTRQHHRRRRNDWARIHQRWRAHQWRNTLFTDESKFQVDFCDKRQHVYRRRGERFSDACVYEMDRFGRASTMVWGGISYYGVTPLVFIDDGQGVGAQRNADRRRGGLTADRYVNEILRPVVLPYLAIHPGMMLQQDNATPHTARVTRTFLQQNNVVTLPWPALSPDLAPIEHVCDFLGKRIRERQLDNVGQLRNALQQEWNALLLPYI